jgi:hypothetical protein
MLQSVMYSNGFLLTIELRAVGPVRLAFGYLLLASPALMLALTAVEIQPWVWMLLLTAVLLCARHGAAFAQISWPASGVAQLFAFDGSSLRASLERAWLVGPLAGLLWRAADGRSVGMLLWRGDQTARAWRLMRVRVLHGAASAGQVIK